MYRIFLALILLSLTSIAAMAQTLPIGHWQLEEYNFTGQIEHPLKDVHSTLVVRANGKLGGDSGCNAYGGSYSTGSDGLKISGIISTMRACQEPSSRFEGSFYRTLQDAVSAKAKGNTLTLRDKAGHYMRFVRLDR